MTPAQYYDAHPELWERWYDSRYGTRGRQPYGVTLPETKRRVREAMERETQQGLLEARKERGYGVD